MEQAFNWTVDMFTAYGGYLLHTGDIGFIRDNLATLEGLLQTVTVVYKGVRHTVAISNGQATVTPEGRVNDFSSFPSVSRSNVGGGAHVE